MNESAWKRTQLVVGTLAAALALGKMVAPWGWQLATAGIERRISETESRIARLESPGYIGPLPGK